MSKKVKCKECENMMNWSVPEKVTDITEKINKAKNTTTVDTLLANAKTYINNVEKNPNNGSNGCGGSVMPTIFGFISMLAVLVVIKKKENF